MFDDEQRIAGIAQALHDRDYAAHIARMQSDGGLVEHEERVDERGAQSGRQINALHLAAGERARLPVEREIAQAHVDEVVKAAADLTQQQVGRRIKWRRQRELAEEFARALDGQQHEIMNRKPWQRI